MLGSSSFGLMGWAIVALVLVAAVFFLAEQRGITTFTSLGDEDVASLQQILDDQLSKYSKETKEELGKLTQLVQDHTKRIENLENQSGKALREPGAGVSSKGDDGSKGASPPTQRPAMPTPTSKPNDVIDTLQVENKEVFDDFASCGKWKVSEVKEKFSAKGRHRYEMIRLGVSSPCTPGSTTDNSVYFTWEETGKCSESSKSIIRIQYWKEDATSSIRQVNAEMVGCFEDDRHRTWRFFGARLGGLVPDSEHVYVIENEVNQTERHFFSPPPPGTGLGETDFILFGDTQIPRAKDVIESLAKLTDYHDLVVHVGDGTYGTNTGECYNKGGSREANTECGWNCSGVSCKGVNRMNAGMMDRLRAFVATFDDCIKGRMPWMSTMGNHDNDLQWFLSQRPCVSAALPGVKPSDLTYDTTKAVQHFAHSGLSMHDQMALAFEYMKEPHFYSFDYGEAHIVSIGTEDNPNNAYENFNGEPFTAELRQRFDQHFGTKSKQYQWLVRDLEQANARRKDVPWIIVFTHRPLYHTSTHHPSCGGGGDWYACLMRDLYEPLLKRYGVNVVATGHSHHYSRSHPMFQGKLDKEGVVHATVGTGGYSLTNHFSRQPEWIATRQGVRFGYVRMTIKNATHAKWTFLSPGPNATNIVVDDTWLTRTA